MAFELVPLPYTPDALGEFMSAETLAFHHGKHHKAYVDKVNTMLADGTDPGRSLVEIVRSARDRGETALFNNSAQIWNHNFYWRCLAPPEGRKPTGRLAAMIDDSFGGTDNLLLKLKEEAAGHFSNGWAWLILDRGTLAVTSLHDADSPVVHDGMKPLLTLDVWEHAYYIDYRNARADFAEKVLGNIVDWDFVERNLDGEGVKRADQER
ncbi:MAG TPA: superoxide dismutase [Allosphingosinicella sp.]|nr:superoxide dismutase [Allosphingosinicella sp.]